MNQALINQEIIVYNFFDNYNDHAKVADLEVVDDPESRFEYKCPVCHKSFYIHCTPEEYGWRLDNELYCSYTCMRKIEKLKLKTIVPEYKLRSMPEDLKDVWGDLVKLRSLSKQYEKLRRRKYSDKLSDEDKQKLTTIIGEYFKRIERIKIKYGYGVGKLSKVDFDLIYHFALCGWDRERLIKETNMSYDELADHFEKLCRILKRFLSSGKYRRRWICG